MGGRAFLPPFFGGAIRADRAGRLHIMERKTVTAFSLGFVLCAGMGALISGPLYAQQTSPVQIPKSAETGSTKCDCGCLVAIYAGQDFIVVDSHNSTIIGGEIQYPASVTIKSYAR